MRKFFEMMIVVTGEGKERLDSILKRGVGQTNLYLLSLVVTHKKEQAKKNA